MAASIALVFLAGLLIGGCYTSVRGKRIMLAIVLGVAAAASLAGAVLWAPQ